MKSHMAFLQSVLDELGTRCRTSTTQDWKTILRRSKDEGMSFLTISLPRLCESLQKGLDLGKVDPSDFVGFSKSGRLPRFLGGFFDLIFSRKSGRLLDNPSIDAIQAIRQICLLYSKILLPCTPERERGAMRSYIKCESDIKSVDFQQSHLYNELAVFCLPIFGSLFSRIEFAIYSGDLVPKHGPGSTSERIIGNEKFSHYDWTERLDYIFPFGEYLFPNHRYSRVNDVNIREPGSEIPVRVVSVPKTLKTPRIIAIEPVSMQYAQQSLMRLFVDEIERDNVLSHFIGFSDQLPNQQMARDGSLSGSLATLDLSEASDRVSNQLVRSLFHRFPLLSEAIDACRSRKADVPGFGVKRLSKFASMGSALCFPIEATVFLSVIFYGISKELNRSLTSKDIKSLIGQVRVYGDDIIVPVEYVRSVVNALETFGFQVNISKSFWNGKFRESCGKEYYAGFDVSVVKVRRMFPSTRKHVQEIVSTVSLRNQLFHAGFGRSVELLDSWIERLIPFPFIGPESPGLGRHTYVNVSVDKMCIDTHRPLVKAYVVSYVLPPSFLEGHAALLKFFLKRGEQPFADRNHLERAGRPKRVDIKLRWVPAY